MHRADGTFTVQRHPHELPPISAEALTQYLRSRQSNVVVTDRQLDQIRQARDALIAQWHAVPLGETMTLTFDSERLAVGS